MLRFLAERAEIHLACLTDEPVAGDSLRELNRLCQRVEIQPLSVRRWAQGFWSLLTGRSATEGLFQSQELKRTVRRWANEIPFDASLVFCSSMFQFADCEELADVPLVVDLVDVDSEKWLNYAETASFPKRQLYHLEAKRVRQLETRVAKRAKAVTLVSEEEVKVFRKFCNTGNVHAISNGVDLEYFHPAAKEDQPRSQVPSDSPSFKLVFVGVLDYRANIEGLRWFCREVWPNVRKQIPQIELDLVGRRPNDAVRELAKRPGINLIGEVGDVRPYVWDADVVIAPLTIARGIQNKVLEALAMAKPVIATPQAIEGTGAVPGKHLMAAFDSNDWVTKLGQLSRQVGLREKLAVRGRDYIKTHAGWPQRLAPLSGLLFSQPSKGMDEAEVMEETLAS